MTRPIFGVTASVEHRFSYQFGQDRYYTKILVHRVIVLWITAFQWERRI